MVTHVHSHTHTHQLGGQSCKRSRWHCGTSLAALCKVSSAHRRLHKWIWNDLPRVSATWAQTHALLHTHTHTHDISFLPPSGLFIQRRWRRDTPTPRGKKTEIWQSCILLCHINWQMHRFTNVRFIIQFRLSFRDLLIYAHFVFRHHGKCARVSARKSKFSAPVFCNIISRNMLYYTLTTRDMSTEAAAHGTTGLGQDIRIAEAVVTYKPLAIIAEKSTPLCLCDKIACTRLNKGSVCM